MAVCDPMFRNVTTNNWSGQAEALTYQRAIRALENYGYDWLVPILGRKLFEAIGPECVFVQQYDPFTMAPSKVCLEGEQDAYGPAMLSVLEYAARIYGIHMEGEQIFTEEQIRMTVTSVHKNRIEQIRIQLPKPVCRDDS